MWHRNYKVVSFYTPDYKIHAEGLIESLKKREIPHEVEVISQRSWPKATCHKAEFILMKLYKSDCPLVWIDADAEVKTYNLRFPDVDFAIYARFADPLRKRFAPFRTGTVYFGKGEIAERLLQAWVKESAAQPDGIDQWSLYRAWLASMGSPKNMPSTQFLPIEYCQKFDEGDQSKALISHNMASRKLKRLK